MTPSYSQQAREEDARIYAESTKAMEATVAEALAEKARDPHLARMTQEELVYEVLKECYDPEIPPVPEFVFVPLWLSASMGELDLHQIRLFIRAKILSEREFIH